MSNVNKWNSALSTDPDAWQYLAEDEERERKVTVWRVQRDLHAAALNLGQTDAQATAKIDLLFSTFAGEWSLYVLTGAPAITTAIQNDITLTWLNTGVGGQTIRQRLINRLS